MVKNESSAIAARGKGDYRVYLVRFIQYVAVVAVMASLNWVMPGIQMPWVAVLAIPILLSGWAMLLEFIAGTRLSPAAYSATAWSTATVVLYLTQFLLPSTHITVIGALVGGSVVWMIGLVMPRIWG